MTDLPDYVRGALAKARLALANASRLDRNPKAKPQSPAPQTEEQA